MSPQNTPPSGTDNTDKWRGDFSGAGLPGAHFIQLAQLPFFRTDF